MQARQRRCNATHIGSWNDACVSCRPDNPEFCLKCDDFCTSRGCEGYFVTREGHCSVCPAGAASCSDLTGEVRECNSGLGLVGGECRPCKVEECLKCDGDLWTCEKCASPLGDVEANFPDPATGICVPCDKRCRACTGLGTCFQCRLTVLDPVTKTCPPCKVANCYECTESLNQCQMCDEGFYLVEASNTWFADVACN
ncbi:hypothetical protein COHA_007652 [Chlorella ohadii]|uniref:Uncharacterized protein n=1 Tax=Chlorella ohadii TaxID=2649997 RepID=A0AAD5GZN2_9CHLO|nr:hypothetical protein COHA_007652 [Chlorella ohadii]